MNLPRIIAALVAGFASALIAYGVVLSHGKPFPLHRVGDAALAYRLIPLELFVGLLVGLAFYNLFGRQTKPRADIQQRMVLRFAHRHGGFFTLEQLSNTSPLEPEQARAVVAQMLESGQLQRDGEGYRLFVDG